MPIQIDIDEKFQTIEGFGASDAWNCEEVGKYWPTEKKERIAELLFSTEMNADGGPRGIGLSRWRFNVGAGSTEQAEESQIVNPHRRVECFLNEDGSYDWSKQAGQQWFLRKAADYGVKHRVIFSNSPPVFFTKNGLAHGSEGFDANLRVDAYDDFAEFLAEVLLHFEEQELGFSEISPINEPQWEWKSDKQEGSPWRNHEIASVVRELDGALIRRSLDVPISIPEAAHLKFLYQEGKRAEQGNQIYEFFDSQSENYVRDLQNVPNMVCGHSYWSVYTDEMLKDTRSKVRETCEKHGLSFHQSEYSLIGLDQIKDHKPETEWEIAMFIARVIHADLTIANSAVWSFWTALADEKPSVKNRYALITLKNRYPWGDTEPVFRATKTLWALGHYSRFIRPGYHRVALSGLPELGNVFGSAYLAEDSKELIIVSQNMGANEVRLKLGDSILAHFGGKSVSSYLSDEHHELSPSELDFRDGILILPGKSMLTVVIPIL
ncbi:MAG: hypothetical protein MI748_03385 [Opitutales bacterium]|nr:hypothetical protein [Opitutales bacterium]